MRLVMITREQDGLRWICCIAKPKWTVDLRDQANQLIARRSVQRKRLRGGAAGGKKQQDESSQNYSLGHEAIPLQIDLGRLDDRIKLPLRRRSAHTHKGETICRVIVP